MTAGDCSISSAIAASQASSGVTALYRARSLHDGETGTVEVAHLPAIDSIEATIRFPNERALPDLRPHTAACGTGCRLATIRCHLAQDPQLAPLGRRAGGPARGLLDGVFEPRGARRCSASR
jgi:hypothetical protein